jgi:squalene-hopene/tetraprenyl-beta-curcumene cyclase
MRFCKSVPLLTIAMALVLATIAIAVEPPITLESVPFGLPEISPDEPRSEQFSMKGVAEYLDRSAFNWQKTKNCATCHTNLFYMFARPALKDSSADSGIVRQFYEAYKTERWKKAIPNAKNNFWPVVIGAGLVVNDTQTTGKLSTVTREVLDIMWQLQREDGGWNWPHCDYAPMEIDDHYGVTIAALAVGLAPEGYAATEQAKSGMERVRSYFKANPPKSLHHRAMLAWISVRLDGIATQDQRTKTLEELLALQLADGGWSTASFLTDWHGLEIDEDKPLDTKTSDGYGTGFVILLARELGVPATDPRLEKGIAWLMSNQRVSGMWFTRSPVKDAGNLISNAGTAFGVLALQACGKLPAGVFGTK